MIKRVIGYAAVLLLMIYLFFMYDDRVISGMLILTGGFVFVSDVFPWETHPEFEAGSTCGRNGERDPGRDHGGEPGLWRCGQI